MLVAVHFDVVPQRGDKDAALFGRVKPSDRMILAHPLRNLAGPDLGRIVTGFIHIQHRGNADVIRVGERIEFIAPNPAVGNTISRGEILIDHRHHAGLQHRVRAHRAADQLFVPDPTARRQIDGGAMHHHGIAAGTHIGLERRALDRGQLLHGRVEQHHGRVLLQILIQSRGIAGPGNLKGVQLGHAFQAIARDRDIFVVILAGHGEHEHAVLAIGQTRNHRSENGGKNE